MKERKKEKEGGRGEGGREGVGREEGRKERRKQERRWRRKKKRMIDRLPGAFDRWEIMERGYIVLLESERRMIWVHRNLSKPTNKK